MDLRVFLRLILHNRRRKVIFILIGLMLIALLWPVPTPLFDAPYATVLNSREGQLLGARIADDGQWRFPPGNALPDKYKQCVVQFEDRYFYMHPGINPIAILRAIRQNISEGKIVSGGSTITMQLARMAMGNQPRTIWQKIKEIWLALHIELRYSKKEILQQYANNAPFGGNVVGLQAAAWRYFGRPADDLSWAEAAYLAVLPNAPGMAFPGKNELRLLNRRNRILKRLVSAGILTPDSYRLAKAEPLPAKTKALPMLAPHLLDRCIKDGYAKKTVKSTLKYSLQIAVYKLVKDYHDLYKYKQVHNACAMVARISDGEVLAYAGNVIDPSDRGHGQQVDIITSRRSPGSLLKPLLYAGAIDRGIISPFQFLPDIPMIYEGFAPQNFDKQFRGAVHANNALRSSLNVPFVSLLRKYGYEQFHHDLHALDFHSLDKPAGHYGLSLILGGGEVTMWELGGAYATLVRSLQRYNLAKGTKRYIDYQPLTYTLSSKKRPEFHENGLFSASAIWHTLHAMQQLRRPDADTNWQQFEESQSIAWKTGTSYGLKDAWAIGMNDDYVICVWMGNASGEGRPDLVGVRAAAPLMFSIFKILGGRANFNKPIADMQEIKFCTQSGYRASDACPETRNLVASRQVLNTAICPYHRMLHLDEKETHQVNSSCYPVQKMHEKPWFILPPAQAWYYRQNHANYTSAPPFLAGCQQPERGILQMIYPRHFTRVFVPLEIDGKPGRVVFEAAHRDVRAEIFWFMDGNYLGSTIRQHQMGVYPEPGTHHLTLQDVQGREINLTFEAVH